MDCFKKYFEGALLSLFSSITLFCFYKQVGVNDRKQLIPSFFPVKF